MIFEEKKLELSKYEQMFQFFLINLSKMDRNTDTATKSLKNSFEPIQTFRKSRGNFNYMALFLSDIVYKMASGTYVNYVTSGQSNKAKLFFNLVPN